MNACESKDEGQGILREPSSPSLYHQLVCYITRARRKILRSLGRILGIVGTHKSDPLFFRSFFSFFSLSLPLSLPHCSCCFLHLIFPIFCAVSLKAPIYTWVILAGIGDCLTSSILSRLQDVSDLLRRRRTCDWKKTLSATRSTKFERIIEALVRCPPRNFHPPGFTNM